MFSINSIHDSMKILFKISITLLFFSLISFETNNQINKIYEDWIQVESSISTGTEDNSLEYFFKRHKEFTETDIYKNMIISVRDEDKAEAVEIAKRFEALGYNIFATKGTARALMDADIQVRMTRKIEQESPNILDLILGHKIDLVIDTPSQGVERSHDGFVIRRNAIETGVNVLTAIDTAKALISSLENADMNQLTLVDIAQI